MNERADFHVGCGRGGTRPSRKALKHILSAAQLDQFLNRIDAQEGIALLFLGEDGEDRGGEIGTVEVKARLDLGIVGIDRKRELLRQVPVLPKKRHPIN
ncbi:MAG: hypothetical protein K9M45_09090 [Kiritimatiellales bacterium]|nr:hypothetical protein [Kiritimatiellales bacterium]